MKKVLLFLAEGFEEVEALTPIDFLRRADVEVTTVGVGGKTVTAAHGVAVNADTALSGLSDADSYDGLVFPGGMPGAENLASEQVLLDLIEKYNSAGKTIAAICAAPGVVLAKTTVLNGKKATCFPGFESYFRDATEFVEDRVVRDGNIITSRGAGTAAEFAIELIRCFADSETAEKIRKSTLQNF